MFRLIAVSALALVVALILIFALRRRNFNEGPHWAVVLLIGLGAIGAA